MLPNTNINLTHFLLCYLNRTLVFVIASLVSVILSSYKEESTIHKVIPVLTKNGILRNTGKLVKIHSTKDSIAINKQLPVFFEVAMFKRVLLRLQASITDSLQNVVRDTIVERTSSPPHRIETFYLKKKKRNFQFQGSINIRF